MRDTVLIHPQFRKPGNDLIRLHNIVLSLSAGKKDVRLYIAKGSLNVDNTNGSSEDSLQ